MIKSLRISNLALIEDISVEFREGLNVFTGETGAGKTVILQGLELLLGARGDAEKVRSGKDYLEVEGLFAVPDGSMARRLMEELALRDEENEGQLLVRRVVSADGKSRCWINGRMCTVSTLSELGEFLVDLHGQHEHQRLLKPANHLEYLDSLGGGGHLEMLGDYVKAYRDWKEALSDLEECRMDDTERVRMMEELKEKIREIEEVSPRKGELEELEEALRAARNREALFRLVSEAFLRLETEDSSGVVDHLAACRAMLEKAAEMDPRLAEAASALDQAWNIALDTARGLRRYLDSMVHDPAEIEAMESRVFALRELYRKHGGGFDEVADCEREARRRLESLEGHLGRMEALRAAAEEREGIMKEMAARLTQSRRILAERLVREVNAELEELGMSGTTFWIEVQVGDLYTETGRDRVEMMISPAPGEDPMPISKVASGGELSRLMLALKVVLARADQVPTMVFDEVDAGIGGATAGKVGEKMARLGSFHQVICVTHLPQIAAYADVQFRIFKADGGERIMTMLEELGEEERVVELARMLGGSEETASRHARELLRGSRKVNSAKRGGGRRAP